MLQHNPDWEGDARREQLNHFFARLIFCFFAEDTNIFVNDAFTDTIARISDADGGNVHEVLAECFRAMNTPRDARDAAGVKRWAKRFPYVNGGLFGTREDDPDDPKRYATPSFTKVARSYLLHIGSLDWKQINPAIFGSMIQAVAEEEERSQLGMHYTSVPNILKVLNPLFLDGLRQNLQDAGDGRDVGSKRKLLNLRRRLARIRVFDPACGSGNFLVIAYKELRKIEAEINRRRGEPTRDSDIPLTNFRGIEIRHFATEVARLALIIAEYQSNVLYQGETLAVKALLPLKVENWITHGNALRLDWSVVCPSFTRSASGGHADLFEASEKTEVAFENEGGEVYVCGNPPYVGSTWQSMDQKADLQHVVGDRVRKWKSLDYVTGWFIKAVDYLRQTEGAAALVSTNSICQGQQVAILWPLVFDAGFEIHFAHTSFKWQNLASHNAGVTVIIVGIAAASSERRRLYGEDQQGDPVMKEVPYINGYLVAGRNVIIEKLTKPCCGQGEMTKGNQPTDGGHLLLSRTDMEALGLSPKQERRFVRRIYGSKEFIRGEVRYCLWIEDAHVEEALAIPAIWARVEGVREIRSRSRKKQTMELAEAPHTFAEVRQRGGETVTLVPSVSSDSRFYLPVGFESPGTVSTNLAFTLYDAPLHNLSLIASKLHLTWIATVCGKLKTDYRYSNTLGWNTFPVPTLTEQNKADLTECAENILLARERYWPATIAEMYDPERMDRDFPEVRAAHERNDGVLEYIYIGRRFRNDTERLEKLFAMYEEMVAE